MLVVSTENGCRGTETACFPRWIRPQGSRPGPRHRSGVGGAQRLELSRLEARSASFAGSDRRSRRSARVGWAAGRGTRRVVQVVQLGQAGFAAGTADTRFDIHAGSGTAVRWEVKLHPA